MMFVLHDLAMRTRTGDRLGRPARTKAVVSANRYRIDFDNNQPMMGITNAENRISLRHCVSAASI